MPIQGVLFDFDGTLTLPGALDFPAIKAQLGCPQDRPVLEFIQDQPPDERKVLMERLEEMEDAAAALSRPNHGAEDCIRALRKRGLRLGILTRNSLSSVSLALERFRGVTVGDFQAVLTRDSALPKPHPDGVLKAAEQLGVAPRDMLVVGDFRFDILAGKAAGAPTVLLTNGDPSPLRPEDSPPDYTITRLDYLLHIIED